ncbi:hypothetical protein E2C01_063583 [Portunus trituberculatus]|uniref:Uncharacterized protein n=1 Tax=Portunus trituberculatus TaxID=210409 RepID=A0A5B7HAT9_PORTR|nr:hypothetical protein [Portunus trituberculatus]
MHEPSLQVYSSSWQDVSSSSTWRRGGSQGKEKGMWQNIVTDKSTVRGVPKRTGSNLGHGQNVGKAYTRGNGSLMDGLSNRNYPILALDLLEEAYAYGSRSSFPYFGGIWRISCAL